MASLPASKAGDFFHVASYSKKDGGVDYLNSKIP